jgi:membrane associated rhomboid family serine protease/Zn-finger nucleic acid-binding protein
MTPSRAGGGLVYACRSCGGCAATFRALAPITTVAAIDGLRAMARKPDAPPSPYGCPSCGKGMVLAAAQHVGVGRTADVCPRCDLAWFPSGEIAKLPRPAAGRGPTPAPIDPGARRAAARASAGSLVALDAPARLGDVPVWLGAPVEIDPVRRTSRPYATYAILAGLVLGACLSISFDSDMARTLARFRSRGYLAALFLAWAPSDFALWHLVVPVHDPWANGGWNLLVAFFANAHPFAAVAYAFWFWVFADDVEALLGRLTFVLLVFGASAFGLLAQTSEPISGAFVYYGASGGLAAVVACYAVMLPRVELGFFGRRSDPILRLPAAFAPLVFALGELVLRAMEAKEARLIPLLVGSAVGAVVGLVVRRPRGAPESA